MPSVAFRRGIPTRQAYHRKSRAANRRASGWNRRANFVHGVAATLIRRPDRESTASNSRTAASMSSATSSRWMLDITVPVDLPPACERPSELPSCRRQRRGQAAPGNRTRRPADNRSLWPRPDRPAGTRSIEPWRPSISRSFSRPCEQLKYVSHCACNSTGRSANDSAISRASAGSGSRAFNSIFRRGSVNDSTSLFWCRRFACLLRPSRFPIAPLRHHDTTRSPLSRL